MGRAAGPAGDRKPLGARTAAVNVRDPARGAAGRRRAVEEDARGVHGRGAPQLVRERTFVAVADQDVVVDSDLYINS